MKKIMSNKVVQVVVSILAVVLCCGLLVALVGDFGDNGGSTGGGGGGGNGGDTEIETYIPSSGDATCVHVMDNGKVFKAATCAETGIKVFTCTKCGFTREEAIAKTTTHTYALREYNDVQHLKYCKVCNTSSYEAHSLNEYSIAATCTSSGSVNYSCSCGYAKSNVIPAMGHTPASSYAMFDSETHKTSCRTCGSVLTDTHNFGSYTVKQAPTCLASGTQTKTCYDCGYIYTDIIPANGHSLVEDTSESVASTCSVAGYKYMVCEASDCDYFTKAPLPLAEHDFQWGKCKVCSYPCPHLKTSTIERTEDNCNFYYEWYCDTCGEFVKMEDVPHRTEHSYSPNYDATHSCSCGAVSNEGCEDNNSDGACDKCDNPVG